MKKQVKPKKLKLATEIVVALKPADLGGVHGGVTSPCAHPTTTVLHTGDC